MTPGYQAPKKVDLKTIQDLDKDDESLVKYKQQLLGQTSEVKGENQQTHTCRGETVLFFFFVVPLYTNCGLCACDTCCKSCPVCVLNYLIKYIIDI